MLAEFGTVESVELMKDGSGQHKGYGYVPTNFFLTICFIKYERGVWHACPRIFMLVPSFMVCNLRGSLMYQASSSRMVLRFYFGTYDYVCENRRCLFVKHLINSKNVAPLCILRYAKFDSLESAKNSSELLNNIDLEGQVCRNALSLPDGSPTDGF